MRKNNQSNMEVCKQRKEYGSLPVPNVQDLASKELKEPPSRYIRPGLETNTCKVSIDASPEVPVIDLQKLLLNQKLLGESDDDEMDRLHRACRDWGFFQLVNHGVPGDLIQKMKSDIAEFFKLPLEEKKAYAKPPDSFHGYGQAFVVSEEQKLDWSDMLILQTLPISERNFKFWPTNPSSFRETLDKYALELKKVTRCLLGLIAKCLGIEPEKLTELYDGGGTQWLRMNYYPPCPQADKVIGISPHSDLSIITLLLQVNDVDGLQIKKDGNWVPIKAIPGAFIVNFGDVIEILSNGIYKSIEHRGVIHPEKERMSIAGFENSKKGLVVSPLAELVGEDGAHYMTVHYDHYLKQYFASELDGKRALDLVKL